MSWRNGTGFLFSVMGLLWMVNISMDNNNKLYNLIHYRNVLSYTVEESKNVEK